MAGDAFDPEDEDGVEGFGSGPSPTGTGSVSYKSTGGTTQQAGGGGGFVNLGQMLALNRKSGEESAGMLNKEVNDKALGAEKGVKDAENAFAGQVEKGSNAFNPNATLDESKAGSKVTTYQGPKAFEQTQGVDMGKMRSDLQGAMDGLDTIKSPHGVGGYAAQKQSLSPRQAAASSFYMGNSNQDFKNTTDRFKGLSGLLGEAGTRSRDLAMGADAGMAGNAAKYGARASHLENQNAIAKKHSVLDARAHDDAMQKSNSNVNAMGGHGKGYGTMSEQTQAAHMGMTYEQYLDAGKPSDMNDPKFTAWYNAKKAKENRG